MKTKLYSWSLTVSFQCRQHCVSFLSFGPNELQAIKRVFLFFCQFELSDQQNTSSKLAVLYIDLMSHTFVHSNTFVCHDFIGV